MNNVLMGIAKAGIKESGKEDLLVKLTLYLLQIILQQLLCYILRTCLRLLVTG